MSQDNDWGNSCCAKPVQGLKRLEFFDGTQVKVVGLDEVLAAAFAEGRPANDDTAEEIMDRLEDKNNYIPSSDRARRQYSYALLKEYREYVRSRADSGR